MTLNDCAVYSKTKPVGGGGKEQPVPHPDEELELSGSPRRRASHFRKKRRDSTTKLIKAPRDASPDSSDVREVVRASHTRHEQWSDVANPAPSLPDPPLHRPVPPPAPLPVESNGKNTTSPGWLEDRKRRKRMEDIVGTIGLALMVTAMLIAMWLRMTGG